MAEHGAKIGPLFRKGTPSKKGGRKRDEDTHFFEDISRLPRRDARWKDLPDCYPYAATRSYRLAEWGRQYG
jgi:hypothetical protein